MLNYSHSESLGFMIYKTQRKLYQFLLARLKPYDITPEQWSILDHLRQDEGINQKELAKRTDKDKTTITRILDILQTKGLIIRKIGSRDRREFFIYLTDEGRELQEKIIPVAIATSQEASKGISPEQQRMLQDVLNMINNNIDAERESMD